MSVHVKRLAASATCAKVIAPGETGSPPSTVAPSATSSLSTDDVTAFEGTLPELRALAARITAVVASVASAVEAGGRP